MLRGRLLISSGIHLAAAVLLVILPTRPPRPVPSEPEIGVSLLATEIRFHSDPAPAQIPKPRPKEIEVQSKPMSDEDPIMDFQKAPTEPKLDLPEARHFREPQTDFELPKRARLSMARKIETPRSEQTTSATEVSNPSDAPSEPSPIQGINKPPPYPRVARVRAWEGAVTLAIEIRQDGTAGDIRIESSSGYQVLDQAAVDAARAWRFNPARHNGQAVSATLKIKVEFKLTEENK